MEKEERRKKKEHLFTYVAPAILKQSFCVSMTNVLDSKKIAQVILSHTSAYRKRQALRLNNNKVTQVTSGETS